MATTKTFVILLFFIILTWLIFPFKNALSQSETDFKTQYSYRYHDQLIVLKPSESLVAVKADDPALTAFSTTNNWRKDPLSETDALRTHDFAIFRTPQADAKGINPTQVAPLAAPLAAAEAGIPAQPVFEQGDSLLIPADELIVAFDREITADEAKAFLDRNAAGQGLLDLHLLMPKTYIVKLSAPENGRVFTVSRNLAALPGITYAEPNFVVVPLYEPRPPIFESKFKLPLGQKASPLAVADGFIPAFSEALSDGFIPALPQMEFLSLPVAWTTVLSEGFESGAPGWQGVPAAGSLDVKPVIQPFRKHSGNGAIYMTGGGTQGVSAPGPYPNGVNNALITPTLNLSSFEEAYAELWFYAKYENPNPNPNPGQSPYYDLGLVFIKDYTTGKSEVLNLLFVYPPYTGDMTADPTTQNGWRRALFRIPPAFRKNNVAVFFGFTSNLTNNAEGLYIVSVQRNPLSLTLDL